MDFIKDLYESRLTRDQNNIKVLSYTDCCERLYLTVLVLELLRQYPTYSKSVRAYAEGTLGYSNYSVYRIQGTDLYNFIYYVKGSDEALSKLKDPEAAKTVAANTKLNTKSIDLYLSSLKTGSVPSRVSEFLMQLESSLRISNSDYKGVRRSIVNFSNLATVDKKQIVTRLAFAVRAKLRSSDVISDLESLIASKDLETDFINDPEQQASTPDIELTPNAINLYRLLVGTKNLAMAKRFLDLAIAGNSIPNVAVAGYMPIIKMVNDFVSAGPRGIAQLRALHNRLK